MSSYLIKFGLYWTNEGEPLCPNDILWRIHRNRPEPQASIAERAIGTTL